LKMTSKILRQIGTVLAFLALVGCGGTGAITVEDERQAGAEAARQLEDQIGLYPGEFLTSYLDSVGRRLVAGLRDTPYYFRFKIIDQAEPNAFATPGGYIYVSRGLMALINTEDELAGILAHEISHVTLRHHAQQAQRGALPDILTLPGRAVGKVVGKDVGDMVNAPLEAVGKTYMSSYGRGQESEADLAGMRLAARAGYDPSALADALNNLERTVSLISGAEAEFSFFDSHPQTPTRVADIELEAASIQWQAGRPFAKNQTALFKRLNGLTWGPNNPMQGIFAGQQFMQADMNFSIMFPDGWQTINTPRFVGAFEPSRKALVLFGSPERPGPADQLAEAFADELRSKAKLEPTEMRAFKIGEWPAFLVRIEDTSGTEPVSIYNVWINSDRSTFQIVAVGADRYRDDLRETALSLRDMTSDERSSIVAYRIRIATAQAGENLDTLSARTGNVFSAEFTAALNGLQPNVELDAAALIKILREESYFAQP
jgi:predicted Zn-dependent protease